MLNISKLLLLTTILCSGNLLAEGELITHPHTHDMNTEVIKPEVIISEETKTEIVKELQAPELPKDKSGMETPDPSEAAKMPNPVLIIPAQPTFPADIRQPSGIDVFYPANKELLMRQLTACDRPIALPQVPGLGKVFIAPWGSINGALPTAAKVYQYLRERGAVKTVILLSRPRFNPLRTCKASVWPSGGYATPITVTYINPLAAKSLLNTPGFGFERDAHLVEPSIETQVLLIQHFLPDAKIVPVLIQPTGRKDLENIAQALAKVSSMPGVVIVAVSNMSNGIPSENEAGILDLKTLGAIQTMDLNIINNSSKTRQAKLSPGEKIVDSPRVIMTGILSSLFLEMDTITWLGYAKSREQPGTPFISGYAAGVASSRSAKLEAVKIAGTEIMMLKESSSRLTKPAAKELLSITRDSLESAAANARYDTPYPKNPELLKRRGVFVTVYSPEGTELASMGTLATGARICTAAAEAARMCVTLEDPQSSHRLNAEEAAQTEIVVSILRDFKTASNWTDVKNGMGVMVTRNDRKCTVLPIIAKRHHWSAEDMLAFACKRAGMRPDAYRSGQINIFTFKTDDYIQLPRPASTSK